VPGFAVFFQAHLFGLAVGVEAEHGLGSSDFYRDDVPDVERDYPSASLRTSVGGDEIDVALGIKDVAAAYGTGGAGFVGGAEAVGALDLDAEEMPALSWRCRILRGAGSWNPTLRLRSRQAVSQKTRDVGHSLAVVASAFTLDFRRAYGTRLFRLLAYPPVNWRAIFGRSLPVPSSLVVGLWSLSLRQMQSNSRDRSSN
jgi:hypothetical protein